MLEMSQKGSNGGPITPLQYPQWRSYQLKSGGRMSTRDCQRGSPIMYNVWNIWKEENRRTVEGIMQLAAATDIAEHQQRNRAATINVWRANDSLVLFINM